MIATKPTTPWAVASLACSILGWLAALPMAATALGPVSDTTGVSAGIAIGMFWLLSTALCLLGVILGHVALRRIDRGEFGGRGRASAGAVLGLLPLFTLLMLVPSNWIRQACLAVAILLVAVVSVMKLSNRSQAGLSRHTALPRSRSKTLLMLTLVNLAVFSAAIAFLATWDGIVFESAVPDVLVNTQWIAVFAALAISTLVSGFLYLWRLRPHESARAHGA